MEIKTVLITGATSGIGKACACKFAKEGWNLILNARDTSKLEKLIYELEMECPKLVTRPLICDVRDREQVKAALENLPADWKTMTRLVVPGMIERGRGHVINIGSIAGDAAYPGGSVYCATKAAVKALSDGLRIDLVDTPLRVTNIKPGMVETNFSVVRYRGDKQAADNFYKGIRPLTGEDVAETVYFAASAPEHIQIAEVLLMPTNQATGTISYKKKSE